MNAAVTSLLGTLVAVAFACLVVWQGERWRDPAARSVVLASAATVIGAVAAVALGGASEAARLAEGVRNLGWLGFLLLLLRRGGSYHRTLDGLYAALAFVLTANATLDLVAPSIPQGLAARDAMLLGFSLRMVFAVGALVAVHNLYSATAPGARAGIGLPMAALTLLWGSDLTFYALCWARHDWASDLEPVRLLALLGVAALIALAARRNDGWTIRLSRTVAFRTVGLAAALLYLVAVIAGAAALDATIGSTAQAVQALVLLGAAGAVGLAMTSARMRAWARVMLAKHLFAHRYDYRAEWLRFTQTLGRPDDDAAPLDVRVAKAIADIVEAPGGALMLPDGDGLTLGARWKWDTLGELPVETATALMPLLASGHIVELDTVRDDSSGDRADREAAQLPEWLLADPSCWAIVPLVHFERLVGAVLLERPALARALDWEDFDLLRLAGRQVASYLAEAKSQEALSDAARFDEFNRRFAFIMHDIKNLVSQLTLVARNAERHADKPAFRADMIATLNASTARMNDLLQRLSQHNKVAAADPRVTELVRVAKVVAAQARARHPVVIAGDVAAVALADPARLEQALVHLVHNAIDASPPAEPVTLTLVRGGGLAGIEIADRGSGMSGEFIRNELFRPFASTKAGGFGIGAHEAKTLIAAMGGRIAVTSTPGGGSRFTVWLPAAEAVSQRRVA